MKKILITGATDGIGRLTALSLAQKGHHLLVHGRSQEKLDKVLADLRKAGDTKAEGYLADLSDLRQVQELVSAVRSKNEHIDVLINNAGVLKTNNTISSDGLDVRFAVNTIAPYILTRGLLPMMKAGARVVNLSSAAQKPVDLEALQGKITLDHMAAYSQSKLGITMWTTSLAEDLKPELLAVSVNPGSLLASKMVKEGFGVAGKDLSIGADILCRAALSDEFAEAYGLYFDNDSGQFAAPHPDNADEAKRSALMQTLDGVVSSLCPPEDEG